ncbi:Nucleolar and coiled-body phosphoprotein 1 [Glycine soja]|nr:Nucleolar and coiled-body phosphoprotein 1 [Glycine max]KAH1201223.1 Nucleolar and coiled-body phosphoprotein 1 [Glycine max]
MKHTDNGAFNSEHKVLLHQSIARYLKHSGFSKTLKKFRSEAQFEKNDLKGSPVDLEEMCLKYFEICFSPDSILSETDDATAATCKAPAIAIFAESQCDAIAIAFFPKPATLYGKDAKSNLNDQNEQVAGVNSKNKEEGKSKEKKKKKSKLVSESLATNVEDDQLESVATAKENKEKDDVSTDAKVINGSETEKKSKSKMKKKDNRSDEGDAIEQIGDPNETVSKEENIEANKEITHEEKKDSKKRKRSISEENGQQVADIKADEETKRRKIENLNESKEQTNGNLEKAGEKSSVQSSQKKQQKGSVEKKPVNAAFQRVQVDKIQFADERLQDNSYWAKDGAENGYGAKAAEILDQVRGRGFRHEKTKKKRGSYRGGQIDLQSHSVKFNYSDED